jgi:hypothetical protein
MDLVLFRQHQVSSTQETRRQKTAGVPPQHKKSEREKRSVLLISGHFQSQSGGLRQTTSAIPKYLQHNFDTVPSRAKK